MRQKKPFTARNLTFCNLSWLLSKAGMVWGYTNPVGKGLDQSDREKKSVLTWSVYNGQYQMTDNEENKMTYQP